MPCNLQVARDGIALCKISCILRNRAGECKILRDVQMFALPLGDAILCTVSSRDVLIRLVAPKLQSIVASMQRPERTPMGVKSLRGKPLTDSHKIATTFYFSLTFTLYGELQPLYLTILSYSPRTTPALQLPSGGGPRLAFSASIHYIYADCCAL